MRFLTWLTTFAVALAAATWLIDGIYFTAGDSLQDKLVPWLLVSLILGVLTSFVKPVLKVLSIPFIIITLGLFLLVINAVLLLLTSSIADAFDLNWHVTGFWPAVGGAIVITVVTWITAGVLGEEDRR